ncbi:N-acetylglucosamine-6-phosphate deacetylase [Peribacillus alkalitolerans]|uniref:N-acetylglucosamine-6-phosphate deacetylase n=1 Tax=Peribacillus alkalitolerans TaxID=1550385 RepID=UPI0013D155EC|nr:N-acetylglucosamine-6-phosphate deacetylase [Peribacillus alkalitolerans]
MSISVLKHADIYTEQGVISNGFLYMQNGKLLAVSQEELDFSPVEEISLPAGVKIVPGFIDIHIHGAAGADAMDSSENSLKAMSSFLPSEGTTSFLPTTMTQSPENIEKALKVINVFSNTVYDGAEIVGVHLEGPFINPSKRGAQPDTHIKKADLALFRKWQESSGNSIKLITLAPEMEGALPIIRELSQNDVIVSVGHSDATYDEVVLAIEAGACHVTHFFNGMSGLHHREPGVVGAGLLRNELTVELICDGIHFRPELINLVLQTKGIDRVVLITDSMRAKGLENGQYELGGQAVLVNQNKASLGDGTLAGSIVSMIDCIRMVHSVTDLPLEDVIKLATVNPAKQIGIFDRKGSIAQGKDADLVVLNEQLEIVMTICRGKIVYHQPL